MSPPTAQARGAVSNIFKRLLKFTCKMSKLRFGPQVRAPLHFCGQCVADAGRRRLRDVHDGEIQNVQASLIDGLLEL